MKNLCYAAVSIVEDYIYLELLMDYNKPNVF